MQEPDSPIGMNSMSLDFIDDALRQSGLVEAG